MRNQFTQFLDDRAKLKRYCQVSSRSPVMAFYDAQSSLRGFQITARQVAAGGHKVACSLKNGLGNIESRKFKVITKFLSQKFTLKLILRDSRNFWTTKIWSYTVFHLNGTGGSHFINIHRICYRSLSAGSFWKTSVISCEYYILFAVIVSCSHHCEHRLNNCHLNGTKWLW